MTALVDSEASDKVLIEFSVKLNAPRVPNSRHSSCTIHDSSGLNGREDYSFAKLLWT